LKDATIGGLDILASRPQGSELVADYLAGEPRVAELFVGAPADLDAYARKAREVAERLGAAQRRRIAGAIRATTPAATSKLQRILDGTGAVVTTGQQAGLFGGPLYTVYKILTAVRLARNLEVELGIPVAPLFWVAADDHDWAEANHVEVVDAANELRRAELADDGAAHPMSARRLAADVEAVREMFIGWLPTTEFQAPLAELLRSAYRPGRTVAAAFAELVHGLFSEFDLLVVDPAHPDFKRAAASVLRRELESSAEHTGLLEARAAELLERGYHAQVTIASDAANVLLDTEDGRDRLMREDGRWLLRRSKRRIEDAELHGMLEREPWRFSPNVLLRPVVESALLPTLAYVGGPAELSYFAQIGPLFKAHGIRPPVAHPRASVVLVEAKVRKVLDKYGLVAADFAKPLHELTTRVVRAEMPDPVVASLDALRTSIRKRWDRLADSAQPVDPTLRGWIEAQRNQALSQVESAEKKIASHLKKRSEITTQQLGKAAVNLYPGGSPQERTLNVLPYLARYGPRLLHAISAALPIEAGAAESAGHRTVQTEV